MFQRHEANPLIRPTDIQPSRPDFEVIGTFNAGVASYKGRTVLIVRVAERPLSSDPDVVLCPYLDVNGEITIRHIARNDPTFDTTDPRKVQHRVTGELYLTSISHLRLAWSDEGVHFRVEAKPFLFPQREGEAFGVEDARVTRLGDTYYINYTAVSPLGVATALASTHDFQEVERHGVIFAPANRDVAIFPQQVNGQYACYHRPMPGMFGSYNIWAATSPDLLHWGAHQLVLSASADGWESGRVGGGAPPLWTERGWLSIYHAADRGDRYCLGAFLTPHDNPTRIIARSKQPILVPEAPYETHGFFGNVVFTCGALLDGDNLRVYYGAADERMALAEASLQQVLNTLAPATVRQ